MHSVILSAAKNLSRMRAHIRVRPALPAGRSLATLGMTILFVALFVVQSAPAVQATGSCVCNGCEGGRSQTGTAAHQAACNSFCQASFCQSGDFIGIPAPTAPAEVPASPVPYSGADAIRGFLKLTAEDRGAGYNANPSLPQVAGQVVRVAITLVGLIFFALTLYGGVLYLTAGGNDEQVKRSSSTIGRAMIGLVIVLFAGAITQFVVNFLTPRAESSLESAPDYVDTSFFGSCPEGYGYVWDVPDDEDGTEQFSGAACQRVR